LTSGLLIYEKMGKDEQTSEGEKEREMLCQFACMLLEGTHLKET